jgi:hypothetical protein
MCICGFVWEIQGALAPMRPDKIKLKIEEEVTALVLATIGQKLQIHSIEFCHVHTVEAVEPTGEELANWPS